MKLSNSPWVFALVLLWAGLVVLICSSSASASELIPRAILLGNPVKTPPTVSPDGKLLAHLAPVEDVLNIWMRTLAAEDDGAATRGISVFAGALVGSRDSRPDVLNEPVVKCEFPVLANEKKSSKGELQEADLMTPAEIAAEIIPQEGISTSYGVSLSLDNTRRFIDYYNTTTLTPEQERTMRNALLPFKAPCCDDNSIATCCCPCNLAKSVWGLSNYLIVEKNYDVDQIRESALQWLRFIHSDYYIIWELNNRGIDPGIYGLSHENACYVDECELPFVDGGCGGMGELRAVISSSPLTPSSTAY
ncbi:hypothetical protein LCGC14_1604940 [marine sediment metagenome]|uniref:Uncharacterized protein n=1 Tax=marine sediment metagenome TaxID=412755 RepID=A0A0F9KQS8_9ZZZZ